MRRDWKSHFASLLSDLPIPSLLFSSSHTHTQGYTTPHPPTTNNVVATAPASWITARRSENPTLCLFLSRRLPNLARRESNYKSSFLFSFSLFFVFLCLAHSSLAYYMYTNKRRTYVLRPQMEINRIIRAREKYRYNRVVSAGSAANKFAPGLTRDLLTWSAPAKIEIKNACNERNWEGSRGFED